MLRDRLERARLSLLGLSIGDALGSRSSSPATVTTYPPGPFRPRPGSGPTTPTAPSSAASSPPASTPRTCPSRGGRPRSRSPRGSAPYDRLGAPPRTAVAGDGQSNRVLRGRPGNGGTQLL